MKATLINVPLYVLNLPASHSVQGPLKPSSPPSPPRVPGSHCPVALPDATHRLITASTAHSFTLRITNTRVSVKATHMRSHIYLQTGCGVDTPRGAAAWSRTPVRARTTIKTDVRTHAAHGQVRLRAANSAAGAAAGTRRVHGVDGDARDQRAHAPRQHLQHGSVHGRGRAPE